jgi:poly(A) polymerase Pap1
MLIFLQDDFFGTLHDILAQMEEVTELQPVPDARVAVMKFKQHGMAIDLLYKKTVRKTQHTVLAASLVFLNSVTVLNPC